MSSSGWLWEQNRYRKITSWVGQPGHPGKDVSFASVKATDHTQSPPRRPQRQWHRHRCGEPDRPQIRTANSQLDAPEPLSRAVMLPRRAAWKTTENLNVTSALSTFSVNVVWRLQEGQLTRVLGPGRQHASPSVWPATFRVMLLCPPSEGPTPATPTAATNTL